MRIWEEGDAMLLEAKNISVNYGHVEALRDASFYVDPGEIVAMIGPNGAGKSTSLKAAFGLVELVRGEILFDGADISTLRPDERVAKGISLVPENRRIFPTMTVIENLEMGCFIRKDADTKAEIERIFELLPALKERRSLKAGVLSTGEQQMLSMGRALIQKPKLLLADEPSAGLSPSYVDIIFDKLVEISKQGIGILLVEQNARMALEIAGRGYVFTVGRICHHDHSKDLLQDKEIEWSFLGGHDNKVVSVTFDSNVWRIAADPEKFPKDPAFDAFRQIHNAIKNNKLLPCIAESTFSIEAIKRTDRKQFLEDSKLKTVKREETINEDGSVEITTTMSPGGVHPGNNPHLERHLLDAIPLGFRVLRQPRIAGITNPDIPPSLYLKDCYVPIQVRQDDFAKYAREIEGRGCGMRQIKAIGELYSGGGNWLDGVPLAPASQSTAIAKAMAEWADGDAIAAHIAYNINYFCTRDIGKSAEPNSILSVNNRQWLENSHNVKFVTPEELSRILNS